jgi:hypothetical protein
LLLGPRSNSARIWPKNVSHFDHPVTHHMFDRMPQWAPRVRDVAAMREVTLHCDAVCPYPSNAVSSCCRRSSTPLAHSPHPHSLSFTAAPCERVRHERAHALVSTPPVLTAASVTGQVRHSTTSASPCCTTAPSPASPRRSRARPPEHAIAMTPSPAKQSSTAAARPAPPHLPCPGRIPPHLDCHTPPSKRPFPDLFRRCGRPPPELLARCRQLPWTAGFGPSLGHP